jgi:amidase
MHGREDTAEQTIVEGRRSSRIVAEAQPLSSLTRRVDVPGHDVAMDDPYAWWPAVRVAKAVRDGDVTIAEVTAATIERVARVDPAVGSVVIPLFDRAHERTRGATTSGPLAGVPMLLKDAGEELAGTSHWVGCRGLRTADHRSAVTTSLAARFEQLGAVIVGKSACPELSAGSTTEPVGFAPTHNPWAPGHSAGGSSGGSAAAVAAGLVPIAHGSDGSGSLRFPAALCGVTTLKPSRGVIPSAPAAGQRDPLGLWTQFVLARHPEDLVAVFEALTADSAPIGIVSRSSLRVGVLDHDPIIGLDVDRDIAAAVRRVGTLLESFGHVVEPDYPAALRTLFGPWWRANTTIIPWVRAGQVAWVAERLGRSPTNDDISADVLDEAARGATTADADVAAALADAAAAMAPVADWWEDHDLLVSPVTLEPAWPHGEPAPMKTGMFAAPFSFTGQPAIVVPAGWTADGRPVAVQIVAAHGCDGQLLHLLTDLHGELRWTDRRPELAKPPLTTT